MCYSKFVVLHFTMFGASMDGQLEFYDTADMTLMNAVEHSCTTDLEWDPTGRYVVTTVSFWNQKVIYFSLS